MATVISKPSMSSKPDDSNLIRLLVDDCTRKPLGTDSKSPTDDLQPAVATAQNASTIPHNDNEQKTMTAIEKRLYCYPAVAEVTAFRYQVGSGDTKFGAAVLLYDWIENVTTPDIKNWLAKHFSADHLPVKIVWLDTGSFKN